MYTKGQIFLSPSGDYVVRGLEIHRHLLKCMFPRVVDGEINTDMFLKASRNIIQVIDKFGKVFAPIKYDMQVNIDKLSQKLSADPKANVTLQKMIMNEMSTAKKSTAADALLWLTRSLRLIQLFFDKLVNGEKEGGPVEDLAAKITDAYDDIIVPHQGWMAQQLFGLLTRMAPTRSQVLLALSENTPGVEYITINTLEILAAQMRSNIDVLQAFLHEHDFGLVL